MDESSLLKWIEAEVSCFTARYGMPRLHEKGDLISEGWIVASKALTKFDSKNKTSLKTFVQSCVRNRLTDIKRKERITEEFIDDSEAPDFVSYVDFCISAEQIMKKNELSFLQGLCAGKRVRDLREEKGNRKCFHRILQLLESNALSQVA